MTAAPAAPSDRIPILDVLRGFALLGVLLVNVQHFVQPSYPALLAAEGARPIDTGALWFVELVAQGKFYPIFSFLFGYGIALQMASAERRGGRFVPFIAWRLSILLLIGVFHEVALWSGDILATYALLGFALLPFRHARDRALVGAGLAWLLVWPLALAALRAGGDLGAFSAEAAARVQSAFATHVEPDRRVARETFRILAMFFLGFAAGRRNLLRPGRLPPRAYRRAARAGLAAGGLGSALVVIGAHRLDPTTLSWTWVGWAALENAAGPGLAAGYVAGLVVLWERPAWRRALAPLAPVGRMALTNYLLQTVCLLAIVWGVRRLGLGPIRPPAGNALAFGLFAAQVAASGWWLRGYRFGPVEWAWRSLSYGRRQPLRAHAGEG